MYFCQENCSNLLLLQRGGNFLFESDTGATHAADGITSWNLREMQHIVVHRSGLMPAWFKIVASGTSAVARADKWCDLYPSIDYEVMMGPDAGAWKPPSSYLIPTVWWWPQCCVVFNMKSSVAPLKCGLSHHVCMLVVVRLLEWGMLAKPVNVCVGTTKDR